jgi:hypothetical protein
MSTMASGSGAGIMSSCDVASCASSVTVKASNVPPPAAASSTTTDPLLLRNPRVAMNHPHDEEDDDDDDVEQDRAKAPVPPPTIHALSLDARQPLVRGTLVHLVRLGFSFGRVHE